MPVNTQNELTVSSHIQTHKSDSVGGNAFEPVVIEIEEDHLRLRGLEDEVP